MNLISIIFGVFLTVQLATAYRAVVLEYGRVNKSSDYEIATIDDEDSIAKLVVSVKTADILVLPEAVLNFAENAVDSLKMPGVNVTACDNASYARLVQRLSCVSRAANLYLVAQLYVKTDCSEEQLHHNDARPCSLNETNVYNSAVVFDRKGALIAVYRKSNVLNEPHVQTPHHPDVTSFKTDFGVEFGVFIGSDILFDSPANALVRKGVRNFVSPSFWKSELPYLTAIQTQQMWSYRHNVTLLVGGANLPSAGVSGSAIHSGRSPALVFEFSNVNLTKILSANVTSTPISYVSELEQLSADAYLESNGLNTSVLPGLQLWTEPLNSYKVEFLKFKEGVTRSTFNNTICVKDICCYYDLELEKTPVPPKQKVYTYAVAVFDGYRKFDISGKSKLNAKQLICSVVACTTEDKPETCSQRLDTDVVIENILFKRLFLHANITTEAKDTNATVAMPNTLSRQILPLPPNNFKFTLSADKDNKLQEVELNLTMSRYDIQTFAIYARNSKLDFVSSDSTTVAVNALLMLALSAFIMFFSR